MQTKGLVLCNIGTGKGKTTAAMGVVVRALGAGMDVFILQFVKANPKDGEDRKSEGEWPLANELKFFDAVNKFISDSSKVDSSIRWNDKVGKVEFEVCGRGFVGILGDQKDKEEHVKAATQGLERAREVMKSGKYQLVVLDEVISAVEVGLLTEDEVASLIKEKPKQLHLVVTGHNKYPKILELCDTVTEMKMIKHGYYEGVEAAPGIDF